MNAITPERRTEAYRNVFRSRDGQIVLAHILEIGGFFSHNISTPEGMAKRNFVQEILSNIGLVDPEGMRSAEVCTALVKGLMKVPIKLKEEEEKS